MLSKILVAFCLVVLVTIGATSFSSLSSPSQLILPLLLIPLIYHLIVELFKRPKRIITSQKAVTMYQAEKTNSKTAPLSGKVVGVNDHDKRLFLKLIGSTGLSLFFMSLVSKEAQASFFGSMPGSGTVALKDSTGTKIDPAEKHPTDGYKISQLDDAGATYFYFGYVNKDGAWYIQRETISGANTGDYRYFKGSTNFATNWGNRTSLAYDDFEDIF